MIELRQSTAGQEVPLGYFLDKTDGDTEETGLTIANTDIKIWKWGATTLANKNSGGATHISNGIYYCVLDATDTNTLGGLVIFVHESGALTVRLECAVLPANVWDSKYSTDKLQVDVTQAGGSAIQQASGYLKVKDDEGNTLANEAKQDIIDTNIDTLVARLTAARAGYLDELAAANIPADVDTLKTYCDILDHATNGLANIKTLIDTIDTVVDAIKAKTDLQPAGVQKNVALANFGFLMVLSSDHITPATGKTITAQISKDGGAFAGCTNGVAEIGNGVYKISLTQAEMNADIVVLKFTEADCDQRIVVFATSA